MALAILRCVFILVSAGVAVIIVKSGTYPPDAPMLPWGIFLGIMAIAVTVIAIDALVPRKRLDTISAVYFGLIVGLFLSYVAGLALTPVLESWQADPLIRNEVQLVLACVLCYVCISMLMQTKNEFRFIIPYVEFTKEVKGRQPFILDTSAVIDGRILDLVETNLFDSRLVMPKFVIHELQMVADSSDRQKRVRGRRGLDILNRLRSSPHVDFSIYDRDLPEFAGQSVDMKLVTLAKHLEGKLVTNDYNLNKIAKLHGVKVINVNDLANALKPQFLPGDEIQIHVLRPGEEPSQGVGYLEDGTMVVVEDGKPYIGQTIGISVTSVLQTSAGRMVFGRYVRTIDHDANAGRSNSQSNHDDTNGREKSNTESRRGNSRRRN
ncbi:MAG: TRAM domain-containing protein [Planctomycetota bacterium]|nr:MAG: TRAM domain-containing protein [Planctomycetota bacterium]